MWTPSHDVGCVCFLQEVKKFSWDLWVQLGASSAPCLAPVENKRRIGQCSLNTPETKVLNGSGT